MFSVPHLLKRSNINAARPNAARDARADAEPAQRYITSNDEKSERHPRGTDTSTLTQTKH